MLLYTEHDIDFDIVKTTANVNKSPYYKDFLNKQKAIEYINIVKSFLNGRKLPFKLQCEGFRDGTVNVHVNKLWEPPDED